MDRLVEAVAEHLCRHESVGLFRLTLDLARWRLGLFAEAGAVEVIKGAVSPPTPGTNAWWRAVAAVREAVYTLRDKGLVHYVREAASWAGLLKKAYAIFSSSSGLPHLSSLRSNPKPSLLHVSRYLLNCLWSIGAVLFT
jgi:hypothetical protein